MQLDLVLAFRCVPVTEETIRAFAFHVNMV